MKYNEGVPQLQTASNEASGVETGMSDGTQE